MSWPAKLFKYSAIRDAANFGALYNPVVEDDNTPHHDAILFNASPQFGQACDTAITDFEPEDDALIVVWDDSVEETAPQVEVLKDPARAGQMQVRMGSTVVAQVSGSAPVSVAALTTLPLSKARALGFASP